MMTTMMMMTTVVAGARRARHTRRLQSGERRISKALHRVARGRARTSEYLDTLTGRRTGERRSAFDIAKYRQACPRQ